MPEFADDLPQPSMPALERPYHVYMPGVGGTGVITVNAILAQAAMLDGLDVKSFDQTGAAQKWGTVLSSLIVSKPGAPVISNKVTIENADLYLGFDLISATDKTNLSVCSPDRTAAVINTDVLPTGEMIRNIHTVMQPDEMVQVILKRTRASRNILVTARVAAERLFGDYMMANMVAVGTAYQAGLLPISGASIERAIMLNGAAAKANMRRSVSPRCLRPITALSPTGSRVSCAGPLRQTRRGSTP
jgi:indolepyruvate ferredoxin oxidoreductase